MSNLRRFQQNFKQAWPDAWVAIQDYITLQLAAEHGWQAVQITVVFAQEKVSVAQLKQQTEHIKTYIGRIPRCRYHFQHKAQAEHTVMLEFIC